MSELIRTGAAARILGTSRQHVVDLVERGALTSRGPGVHRRLDRHEVEALVRDGPTRDQRKSLWLHTAVAGRLVKDPQATLLRARANLAVLQAAHARPSAWIARWGELVERGPMAVLEALTADTPDARDLRQNSPFAGVLTERERSQALESFRLAERAPGP